MLALYPELVRMDRATPIDPPAESVPLTAYDAYGDNRVGWALSAAEMEELTEAGNIGDPTAATRETGEALVTAAVENICELVNSLEAGD